jgi:DUF4097 and DUF4098 domain-containing protein YvlB
MKKVFVLFACGLQVLTAGAQSSGHTQPFMQKSFARESIRTLEAETSGGNITVYGEAAGEARIEVYIRSNHGNDDDLTKEEIQKRLDEQYDLNVSLNGNKLEAIAKPKDRNMNWRHGLSISFKAYVPQAVSSTLLTSGGNISLKNLSGTEDFKTSGGNLDIDQVSGKITGRTSGGNVSITDSKEDIDLHTSGGNVEAEHCQGTLTLVTSGGNLILRSLKGTVHANTSGGQVEGEAIDGELQTRTSGGNISLRDLSCSLRASTSGGNIDVRIKTPGKYLDLSNSSGDISVELPQGQGLDLKVYGERVHTSTLNNFKGESDEKHISGALNGGGMPVNVHGSSGSVHLSFT